LPLLYAQEWRLQVYVWRKNTDRKKIMKYKRVTLDLYYVVRAGDDEMIQHAKDCLYEDIMSAYKSDTLYDCIRVIDAHEAKEEDIPEFLQEKIE
jgi:hypothetical protein